MRTQFGTIPLLTLLAASSLTAGSGCSDLSAGRLEPPKGGPKLVRAMVQDFAYFGGPLQRRSITDLLDDTAPVACAVDNPCVTQYLIGRLTPDLTCHDDGFCFDSLKTPATGVELSADSTGIRLVFNKQLDPGIETTNVDSNGAQITGQKNSLHPGIVEVLGPGEVPLTITAFWDNSGATTFTSDVILIPFGPAIVINPLDFQANTTYTIRLHPGQLKDEEGEAATNADGTPLADPTDLKFTTEPLTANDGADSVDFTGPVSIVPNDVIQIGFWEDADDTTAVATAASTGPAGFDPAAVEIYADRGDSPVAADCSAAENPQQLDIVYTTGTGAARAPADWPAGDYSLVFTVKSPGGTSTYTSDPLVFTVAGSDVTDPTIDPMIVAVHVTPEQCL
jgi:hypothetical protein